MNLVGVSYYFPGAPIFGGSHFTFFENLKPLTRTQTRIFESEDLDEVRIRGVPPQRGGVGKGKLFCERPDSFA